MKIAIASEGKTKDSTVSGRAGRAPYYLIFESKKLLEAWKNPFAVGGGGAGFSVAKVLGDKGVKKIIAGKAGPNYAVALKERGIKFKEAEGKVSAFLK